MDSIQLQVIHLILWNIYLKCKYLTVFGQNLHHIICIKSLIVHTFFGHITFFWRISLWYFNHSEPNILVVLWYTLLKALKHLLFKVIELEINKSYSKILWVCMCVCACALWVNLFCCISSKLISLSQHSMCICLWLGSSIEQLVQPMGGY